MRDFKEELLQEAEFWTRLIKECQGKCLAELRYREALSLVEKKLAQLEETILRL